MLIVFSAFGFLGSLMGWSMRDWPMMQQAIAAYHYPVSFDTLMEVALIGCIVRLLCGVAILRRMGWTRYIYTVWSVLMGGYSLWVGPWPLFVIIPVLFTFAVAVVLFLPSNNRWFAGKSESPSP